MTSSQRRISWPSAISEAAARDRLALPPFTLAAMGSATLRDHRGGRFVTFKRPLVSLAEAEKRGVTWRLWREEEGQPEAVAAFKEPLTPAPERISAVLAILRGWLLEDWSFEQAKEAVASQPGAMIELLPTPSEPRREYWLSANKEFGIIAHDDGWAIHSRGSSLSSWRSKTDDRLGDRLPFSTLDCLCEWLARHWAPIAFGCDYRPGIIRETSVAANRAYDNVQLMKQKNGQGEIASWWSKHAIRAASDELPNIFLERQADDMVVSWDASPTSTRYFSIPYGEAVLPVTFAVPVLRQLVRSRLRTLDLKETDRTQLLSDTADDSMAGYTILARYKKGIEKEWLAQHGFSDDDARTFAVTGASRSTAVGLLRTSQDSPMSVEDYEKVLNLLKPSSANSYRSLREITKSITATLDVREPWESGYRLAALVREKLGKVSGDPIDPEVDARNLGIDVQEVQLDDREIRGACIGSPAYGPLIVLNSSCPDASGPSGRRITIAHELCHLFFDRSRMESLARFEGGGADSDRLIEMRANAFAVELIVPMSNLIKDDGTILKDEELTPISVSRLVSMAALSRHATNLRNRLSKPRA